MNHIDIADAPHAPMLPLVAMQTAADKRAEHFTLVTLRRHVVATDHAATSIDLIVHVLHALGHLLVLLDRAPIQIALVLLRSPIIDGRVMVAERRRVNRRLAARSRRSEIVQRRTDAADHRRILRTRCRFVVALLFWRRPVFGKAERSA